MRPLPFLKPLFLSVDDKFFAQTVGEGFLPPCPIEKVEFFAQAFANFPFSGAKGGAFSLIHDEENAKEVTAITEQPRPRFNHFLPQRWIHGAKESVFKHHVELPR